MSPALVQSVDVRARVLVLEPEGDAHEHTYRATPDLSNLDRIITGQTVKATLARELTIYVSEDGRSPDVGGTPLEARAPDARVLTVDVSYRLLTLQYPNGEAETFKMPPEVKLKDMESGDYVAIRTLGIDSLSVRKW